MAESDLARNREGAKNLATKGHKTRNTFRVVGVVRGSWFSAVTYQRLDINHAAAACRACRAEVADEGGAPAPHLAPHRPATRTAERPCRPSLSKRHHLAHGASHALHIAFAQTPQRPFDNADRNGGIRGQARDSKARDSKRVGAWGSAGVMGFHVPMASTQGEHS